MFVLLLNVSLFCQHELIQTRYLWKVWIESKVYNLLAYICRCICKFFITSKELSIVASAAGSSEEGLETD